MVDELILHKFYSSDLEKKVLATCLTNKEALFTVVAELKEEDFYSPPFVKIYREILKCVDENRGVDPIILAASGRLVKDFPEDIKFVIADIMASGGLVSMINDYIVAMKDFVLKRKLYRYICRLETVLRENQNSAVAIRDKAEEELIGIGEQRSSNYETLTGIVLNTMSAIENQDSQLGFGYASGFRGLDSILYGLKRGQFMLIAGRPGMGKSAFSLNLGYNIVKNNDVGVGFFTLEMDSISVVLRMLSSVSEIPERKIRSCNVDDIQMSKLSSVVDDFSKLRGFYIDKSVRNLLELKAKIRRMKMTANIGVIFVDYIQLLQPTKLRRSRYEDMSEISTFLKQLAISENVCVVGVSQLNRKVEERVDKTPVLSDLRESGMLEQDADVIIFLFRPYYYDDEVDPNLAYLFVAKNRTGEIGKLDLRWQPDIVKFTEFRGGLK